MLFPIVNFFKCVVTGVLNYLLAGVSLSFRRFTTSNANSLQKQVPAIILRDTSSISHLLTSYRLLVDDISGQM